MEETKAPEIAEQKVVPWKFTPLLYFMQAIPVALIQEVSTIIYKSMGVENSQITFWTSLIALPWSLQFLLGPFVDFNGSKRKWIGLGQLAVALGLVGYALALQLPNFLHISLGIFFITGIFSAMCNIATDGFYILALTKEKQAAYIGLNSTFYRLGRLFCTGILVTIAGRMMTIPPLEVSVPEGYTIKVAREEKIPDQEKPKVIESEDSAYKFFVIDNALTTEFAGKRWKIEPKVDLPIGTLGVAIDERGLVKATKFGGQVVEAGYIQASGPNVTMLTKPTFTVSGGGTSMNPALAWGLIVGLTVAIYGLGRFILTFTLPRPVLDVDRGFKWESIRQNLLQTLVIIGAFLAGVIAAGNVLKFIGTGLAATIGNAESPNKVLKEIATWRLAPEVMQAELMWFIGCVVLCVGLVLAGKGLLKDTEMETSFKAFLGQSGIMAILAFMLFYRFPEAMVGRISNLFYLDPTTKGGLGMSAEQVGIVSGTMGVIGIVLGGIAGGLTLSRLGLRKAFWPLALAMHVPNFLYLWAFYNKPIIPLGAGFNEVIFSPISIIVFVDQFGSGYGFAAYMVYLMWVAQRGRFQTSHYAIGTGLGALFIAAAGILSGQIQKNYGFDGVYWTVVALAIPGLLVLKAIPLDEHEGRNIKVEEIGD